MTLRELWLVVPEFFTLLFGLHSIQLDARITEIPLKVDGVIQYQIEGSEFTVKVTSLEEPTPKGDVVVRLHFGDGVFAGGGTTHLDPTKI